jgi:hypothetical protein
MLLADQGADDLGSLSTEQLIARCEARLEAGRAEHEAETAGLSVEQLVNRCEALIRDSQRANN